MYNNNPPTPPTPPAHHHRYPLIRKTAAEMGADIQVLGDLQGPKFRVGELLDEPIIIGKELVYI